MIEISYAFGTMIVYCDGCDNEEAFRQGFGGKVDFMRTIEEIKEFGWKIRKIKGEWSHFCPDCVSETDKK